MSPWSVVKRRLVGSRKLGRLLPDEIYLRWRFEGRMGRPPDLRHPRTFNEKLQWLKLHWRDPRCPTCVDKVAARGYVEERCGPELLSRLHGVWARPEEIDPGELPDAFVLKASHGSGFNLICPDKARLDWPAVREQLRHWLRREFGRRDREWPYYHVPRRILCEEFLGHGEQLPEDFKLFCFGGEPRYVEVHTGKGRDFRMALYDLDWDMLDIVLEHPLPDRPAPRPASLPEMVTAARRLAEGFPFVRVDLYQVRERPVFGELTFFPTAGMKVFGRPEDDLLLGGHLRLPAMR